MSTASGKSKTTTLTTSIGIRTSTSTGTAPGTSGTAPPAPVPPDVHAFRASKAPTYKLGGNIDTFLSRLNNYFDLCVGLDDKFKVATFLGQLDKAMYQILQHAIIPDVNRASYDRFKVHIQKRFAPKQHEQELRLNFRSSTQTSNNRLMNFMKLCLNWLKKHFLVKIQMITYEINLFKGLTITPLESSCPPDSNTALVLAKRYLAAQTLSSRCELNQHVQNSVTASVRGRERSQSVATRTSDGKPICFNCRKPGHLALHCRSFDNNGRNRGCSIDCFNSGRRGGNLSTTWSRNCSNSYNNNED